MKKALKMTVALGMAIVLAFTLNLNVFADHMSSWEYSTLKTNYGVRNETYIYSNNTEINSYAKINLPGYTDDMTSFTFWSVGWKDNLNADYLEKSEMGTISDFYPESISTNIRRQIVSIPTSEEPIALASSEVLMHSIGYATVTFCDYVFDEALGGYHFDTVSSTSHEIHNVDHNASKCPMCELWYN